MFHSRAKSHKIDEALDRLREADAALCSAALTNTLTKRTDEWLRNIIALVRTFKDVHEREAKERHHD